ncbi:P-loop containing nucleoside triphosphate hydrolase protein [Phlegmacium glaucopus]|nr:P-loop containing nucleoside triphosphate hydrolase protein [Phlegmacium glaucopus]
MESQTAQLAHYLLQILEKKSLYSVPGSTEPQQRLLVGVSGIPASGKSTFAQLLTQRINDILDKQSTTATTQDIQPIEHPQAILVGLDGWHYTRAQLDIFPDPQIAHDRRGSHWTFDGAGYVSFIRALRGTITSRVITAPSFDHALKDPTPHAISIYPYHRIVIIEGLYTFLAIEPWSEGGLLLDERWFVQVDPVEARRRLIKRHVLTGVAKDLKEAEWRADENDGPNGLFVIGNMLEPTRIIESKDDPSLDSECKI